MNKLNFYLVKDKATQEIFSVRDLRNGRFLVVDNFTIDDNVRYTTTTVILNSRITLDILEDLGSVYSNNIKDKYPEYFL